MQLVMQFVDFFARFGQGVPASLGDLVDATAAPAHCFHCRYEKAVAFESVQKRVQRTRADAIAVVPELFHHGEAEDGLMRCVHQHVDADEAVEELALLFQHSMNITRRDEKSVGCYRNSIYIDWCFAPV